MQEFDETCTFFCVCEELFVPLHVECVLNEKIEEQKQQNIMKRIVTFIIAAVVAVSASAENYYHVAIGDLYYDLDGSAKTARVVPQNSSSPYWTTVITTADIPATVPYKAEDYKVTTIADNAFRDCKSLTNVTIGDNVTTIGEYAFSGCSPSASIVIPNNVTSIGYDAFYGCKHVVLNAKHCNDFTETQTIVERPSSDNPPFIELGEELEYIPSYYCNNLYRSCLYLPKSVKEFGTYALDAHISDFSVSSANPYFFAFTGEAYLHSHPNHNHVLYDKNVETVVKFANAGYSGTVIVLPASVKRIADRAFAKAANLKSITCYAIQPPALGTDAIDDIDKAACKLYVPAQSLQTYKTTPVWKDFGDNIFPIDAPTAIDQISPKRSTLNAKRIANGVLLIEHNGLLFNAQGTRVK